MMLRAWLELGRVSNLPTVWSNVLAGAVLGGGQIEAVPLAVVLGSGTALYVGGMFLNDAFDAAIDARERPERPIPSGRVAKGAVFGAGFLLLSLGVLLLMTTHALGGVKGPRAAFAGACTALLILFYDRFHKGFAWSPVVMGMCRAGLYALSALAFNHELGSGVAIAALLLLAYVVGLTHVARFEASSVIERMWPALFVFGPILSGFYQARLLSPAELVVLVPILLLAVGWVAYAIWLARLGGPLRIRSAVGRLIAGIALLDALSLSVHGAPWLAGLSLVLFGATLLFQRRVHGT